MPSCRWTTVALVVVALPLAAQRPDSAVTLPELTSTAVRSTLPQAAAGLSHTTLSGDSARRGRRIPTLDELLAFVPGVLARERTDLTLDTRIVMRGVGARANFGVRGIRVLVDGVPATLPDGQTALPMIDGGWLDAVEVARGPLASLHGNGSHGVIAFRTATTPSTARAIEATILGDPLGTHTAVRAALTAGVRSGPLGATIAGGYLTTPGWRVHSAGRRLHWRIGSTWQATDHTAVTVRGTWVRDADLESPGALTLAEFANDPRSAAPNSVARDASKTISQRQLSMQVVHRRNRVGLETTAWTLWRDLENPLAAPAPAPAPPREGTWVGIGRQVVGVRSAAELPWRGAGGISVGVDVQRMRDDRVNRRHEQGVVTGTAFLDQRETVTEVGLFGSTTFGIGHGVTVRGGGRHDAVTFDVDDHLAPAAGGRRTMSAWSASAGVAWQGAWWESWASAGTAFETPTTTELANRPDGSTGLNRSLDPSRTISAEVGLRHRRGGHRIEAVGFRAKTRDAITAIAESDGRSYFANSGTTHTVGVELSAAVAIGSEVAVQGSLTALRARFDDDAIAASGASVADNALPGVPPLVARVGLTWRHGGWLADADHQWAGAVKADDRNLLSVPGWGGGITNLLLRRRDLLRGMDVTFAVRNLLDRRHAVGVVVNGGGGRVVEPGSGRLLTVAVGYRM